MEIKIERIESQNETNIPIFDENLGFGKYFSDHMFMMEYANGEWQNARIVPRKKIALDPATMCFHYGQTIFEGMKAYKNADDVYLFRPEMNLRRMNQSAKRLCMPKMDEETFLNAVRKLTLLEKKWIPEKTNYSLYLRPTMIATEPFLGVRASSSYLFYIIASPVGPYYSKGFNPIDIYVCENYTRAVRGGIGEAKAGGNYAASLIAQAEGKKHGCGQVLWLDGVERKYIEEVGAMNLFVRFKNELATSDLHGSILPGVTRDTLIKIARSWGEKVSERKISIEELIKGIETGDVLEVFGSGTAAVISPVGRLFYRGEFKTVNNGEVGDFSKKIFKYLTDLQKGLIQDKFSFVSKVDPYILKDISFSKSGNIGPETHVITQ